MNALINEYYISGMKLIGRVGENTIGLTKGRFFSVELEKLVDTAGYDSCGIKYTLGKKGTTPIGELFRSELETLTFGIYEGSGIAKAQEIASTIFGCNESPKVTSVKEFKTCKVTIYRWEIMGRVFNLSERTSRSGTSDLQII